MQLLGQDEWLYGIDFAINLTFQRNTKTREATAGLRPRISFFVAPHRKDQCPAFCHVLLRQQRQHELLPVAGEVPAHGRVTAVSRLGYIM